MESRHYRHRTEAVTISAYNKQLIYIHITDKNKPIVNDYLNLITTAYFFVGVFTLAFWDVYNM